jgi:cyclopropane-fatty-acyl-phospholipid synthase
MPTQSPIKSRHLVDAGHTVKSGGSWLQRLLSRRFEALLDQIDAGLASGSIEGHLPDGSVRIFGAHGSGPHAVVAIRSWMPMMRLWMSGSVGWYHAWAQGEWTSPDPVQVFEIIVRNRASLGEAGRARGLGRHVNRTVHALRRNTRAGAARNIPVHYDLGNDFFAAWLDETMSYSSAVFAEPDGDEPLEVAQERKVRALLDRLSLRPGDKLLDIGCGWGTLARIAARDYGVKVTAITLSPAQKSWADRHAQNAGLFGKISTRLTDYRDIDGQFDAIASVEMVEAVGQDYWPAYLDTIERVLKPGGRAAIQFISIAEDVFDAYARNTDFIQTYIFPGGMLLSEERFSALAVARGFSWEDRFSFGAHYAATIKRWRARLDLAVEGGRLPHGFDQRFVDLWRYYLMYCEGGFRGGGIDVTQVTMHKAYEQKSMG